MQNTLFHLQYCWWMNMYSLLLKTIASSVSHQVFRKQWRNTFADTNVERTCGVTLKTASAFSNTELMCSNIYHIPKYGPGEGISELKGPCVIAVDVFFCTGLHGWRTYKGQGGLFF